MLTSEDTFDSCRSSILDKKHRDSNVPLLPESAKKKKDTIDRFFFITAAAALVDLLSGIFNAFCKKFDLQSAKICVFWLVTSIFFILNFLFIYNSIKKLLKLKKKHDQQSISDIEFRIKGSAEVMSVSSGALYFSKGLFTLFLVLGISDEFSKVILAVGVLAPICDLFGTIIRAVDSYKYDNEPAVSTTNQKDLLKQRLSSPNFVLAICDSVLAVFALACAAIEIISLHGHAESTYDFDNMAVIYINISLCVLYLALFAIHYFIDNKNNSRVSKDDNLHEDGLQFSRTEPYSSGINGQAAA